MTTRKDQIEEAANGIIAPAHYVGFKKGAEWADKHSLDGDNYWDRITTLEAKLASVVEDLDSLIAHSYSWIVEEKTGAILSKTNSEYRNKIKEIIAKIKDMK